MAQLSVFLFIYGQDPVNVIYCSDTVCVSHFQTASKGAEWPGLSVSMKWDFKKMSPPTNRIPGISKGQGRGPACEHWCQWLVGGSWEACGRLAGDVSSTPAGMLAAYRQVLALSCAPIYNISHNLPVPQTALRNGRVCLRKSSGL